MLKLLTFLLIVTSTSARLEAPSACVHNRPCYEICGRNMTLPADMQQSSWQCYKIRLPGKLSMMVPKALNDIRVTTILLQAPVATCESPIKIELTPEALEGLDSLETLVLNCVELSFEVHSADLLANAASDRQSAISGIPDHFFSYFPSLTKLNLCHISIPSSSNLDFLHAHLPKLTFMMLEDNSLAVMEAKSFRNFPNLEVLVIVNNGPTHLDAAMHNGLGKLRILVLGNNNITVIGNTTLDSAGQGEGSWLERNKIKEVEDGSPDSLSEITKIDLGSNQESFPEVNAEQHGAEFLDLTGNNITSLWQRVVEGFGAVEWLLPSQAR